MKLKSSRYNLSILNNNIMYLLNTASGSKVRLDKEKGNIVCKILDYIDKTGSIPWDGDSIVNFLIKNGFVVKKDLDEFSEVVKNFVEQNKNSPELILIIVPTSRCNMNCYYCFEDDKSNTSLDLQDINSVISFIDNRLEDGGILTINWFGGEPLLEKDFIYQTSRYIQDICREKNVQYNASLSSNCYFLDLDIALCLKESGIQCIQVTFDGAPDYHDQIRRHFNHKTNQSYNSFYPIVKGIQSAFGILDIKARVNVSYENINGIPSLIKILYNEGFADKLKGLYFFPLYNYKISNLDNHYLPIANKYFTIKKFASREKDLVRLASKYGFILNNPIINPKRGCQAIYNNGYVIDSNGELKKCEHEIGSPQAAFSSIYSPNNVYPERLEKWIKYRPGSAKRCKECIFFPLCYSGCPHKNLTNCNEEDLCPSYKYNWKETFHYYLAQEYSKRKIGTGFKNGN